MYYYIHIIQASYIPVLLFFRGGKVNVNLICMIELFSEDKFYYKFIWNLFLHSTGSLYLIFCPGKLRILKAENARVHHSPGNSSLTFDSTGGSKIQMTTAWVRGNKRGEEQRQ